uniref:small ribosomal subunit protein bS18m n=1 Tax=Monopterus albus TaxID=43700 RepID=UPI0009B38F6F|nr:28S ribosomal protein S18c, mitochondrial [Monopterus albus]
MLSLRGLQRLKPLLSQHGNSSLRRFTASSDVVQREDDMLVKMDNPYKEPHKRCVLCNVTVDYKNIQVSEAPVLLSDNSDVQVQEQTGLLVYLKIRLSAVRMKFIVYSVTVSTCLWELIRVSTTRALLPFSGFMSLTHKHPQFMRDPSICGIKHLD